MALYHGNACINGCYVSGKTSKSIITQETLPAIVPLIL